MKNIINPKTTKLGTINNKRPNKKKKPISFSTKYSQILVSNRTYAPSTSFTTLLEPP